MSESVFENYTPSSREFSGGEYAVKRFQAQNGAELKILYGDRISQRTVKLTYKNMNDVKVSEFLDHYISKQGTYQSFSLTNSNLETGVFAGWTGSMDTINRDGAIQDAKRVKWAYAKEPIVTSVFKGLSTIQIELIATA